MGLLRPGDAGEDGHTKPHVFSHKVLLVRAIFQQEISEVRVGEAVCQE